MATRWIDMILFQAGVISADELATRLHKSETAEESPYAHCTEYGRSILKDYMEKYPTWEPANVVEGSVAQVIDDPARLIGERCSTQRNKQPDKT